MVSPSYSSAIFLMNVFAEQRWRRSRRKQAYPFVFFFFNMQYIYIYIYFPPRFGHLQDSLFISGLEKFEHDGLGVFYFGIYPTVILGYSI